MMLTANQCHKLGITYAAVHDSFWTHAADVDHMNRILRDQFIELHESPLITNLSDNFVKRYPH
jgi:DNA-directed RNA polymerase